VRALASKWITLIGRMNSSTLRAATQIFKALQHAGGARQLWKVVKPVSMGNLKRLSQSYPFSEKSLNSG